MSLFRLHYPQSRSVRDAIARVLSIVRSECGARARNDTFRSRAVPGIMRSATTSAPWGATTGLGQAGAGNARSQLRPMLPPEGGTSQIGAPATSQEAWPGAARHGRKPVRQNRGGTPTGERIRKMRGRASCTAGRKQASVGVPLPFLSSVLPVRSVSLCSSLPGLTRQSMRRVRCTNGWLRPVESRHGPPGQARW